MNKTQGLEEIDGGIKVIAKLLKDIKSPQDKNSMKELKESLALLKKKAKLLKSNEQLAVQYLDRTAFDTVQGVFQALHLYIISTEFNTGIDEAVEWLRSNETAYDIANRMQAAALARSDFNNGKKK